MTEDVALQRVVNRTALVENILNQIIEAYFVPRKAASQFFWDVFMDSSILPLGSKLKVAMAISQALDRRLDQDSLHKVVSLRNAFAHHATDANAVISVGRSPANDRLDYNLHVITNSGLISKTTREAALTQFDEAFSKAKNSLVALLGAIRESNGQSGEALGPVNGNRSGSFT